MNDGKPRLASVVRLCAKKRNQFHGYPSIYRLQSSSKLAVKFYFRSILNFAFCLALSLAIGMMLFALYLSFLASALLAAAKHAPDAWHQHEPEVLSFCQEHLNIPAVTKTVATFYPAVYVVLKRLYT
jgi:hypothetical protein